RQSGDTRELLLFKVTLVLCCHTLSQTSSIPCMYIVLPHSLKFYFSTGWSYSTCLQYHYVADQKTWTEAQTYCRQTYADLATIGNKEQNDQLLDTITSAGQKVWMGLYSTIDWRWSDGFSGVGDNYSNWRSDQPDFYLAAEFCVLVRNIWQILPNIFLPYSKTLLVKRRNYYWENVGQSRRGYKRGSGV
uniref:C-type lectin domain-containing protein n=1 Tax=Gouania willdenowi TaxID=441366 RepID=A0A8C5G5Y8_GOUWI